MEEEHGSERQDGGAVPLSAPDKCMRGESVEPTITEKLPSPAKCSPVLADRSLRRKSEADQSSTSPVLGASVAAFFGLADRAKAERAATMKRVRAERMAAEAQAVADEYRKNQANVGTKSFGSTVF